MKAILFLFMIVSLNFAHAATVPTGDFDCSKTRGSFHVSISSPGSITLMEVRHVLDQEETTLQGPALVSSQKFANGSFLNRIRLPGSSIELFFDDQGNLGIEPKTLDCRKI